MKRKLVYVSGPLMSHGLQATNIRRAGEICIRLMKAGIDAHCPHTTWFMDLFSDDPPDYERWISLDFNLLSRCDGILRLPGISPGADREVMLAEELGIPVFQDVEEVIAWARAA